MGIFDRQNPTDPTPACESCEWATVGEAGLYCHKKKSRRGTSEVCGAYVCDLTKRVPLPRPALWVPDLDGDALELD